MPSSIRSSSRERISAFFSRSSSRTRRAESGENLQKSAPPSSFEATGRNRLIRARSDSNTSALGTPTSAAPTPAVAYPPSSFKPTAAPKISRRQSWGSAIDSILRPSSLFGDGSTSRSTSPSPSSRSASRPASINVSRVNSRPPSRASVSLQKIPSAPTQVLTTESIPEKKLLRKSWLPRSSRNKAKSDDKPASSAWIAGDVGKMPYNITPLISAEPVRELWDDCGDTLVYLFPRTSDKGPSFKVRSSIFASSATLTKLAHGTSQHTRREKRSQALEHQVYTMHPGLATPPMTPKVSTPDSGSYASSRGRRTSDIFSEEPPRQISLYLPVTLSTDVALLSAHEVEIPLTQDDIDKLIGVRNLFAFLLGQSIVATDRRSTLFTLFLDISQSLRFYDFTNIDGSTFGEIADTSFDCYVDELGLADVRASREKTIEAVVLGEKMRSALLYNEAFVHAVGKYHDLQLPPRMVGSSTKYNIISPITRNRMERASIDLQQREKSVNTRLLDFDFPSLFAGILDSKTADERKVVNFGAWKEAFLATRKHVMSYYKQKYGSWPPKARSKKNEFESGGLNRMIVRDIYHDFSSMYDLFVDRTSRTTRTSDVLPPPKPDDDGLTESVTRVLRRVFDEYDRSSPPVQPPVPYDTPLLPMLAMTGDPQQDAKIRNRKLKDDELLGMLANATNRDMLPLAVQEKSRFLASIRWFERREARNRNVGEIVSLRAGMWMFLYVVLQALPMLVVDAPGVRYHHNVEYFLCEPPRNGLPWVAVGSTDGPGRGRAGRSWYGVTGGTGVVSLPSDVVEHGVEGVYRRSHCWIMAAKWKDEYQPRRENQRDGGRLEKEWQNQQDPHDMMPQRDSTSSNPNEPVTPPPVLAEQVSAAPALLPQSLARLTAIKRPPPISRPPSLAGRPPSIYTNIDSAPFISRDWPTPLATSARSTGSYPFPVSPIFTPTTPIYNSPMSYQLPSPYQSQFPLDLPPQPQYYTAPQPSSVPPQIPPMSLRRPQSLAPSSSYTAPSASASASSSTTSITPRASSQGPVGRSTAASPSAWRGAAAPPVAVAVPYSSTNRDSVVALGLEALPLPPGVSLGGSADDVGGIDKGFTGNVGGAGVAAAGARPGSAQGASATFDEIIGNIERERGRAQARVRKERRSGSWVRGGVVLG